MLSQGERCGWFYAPLLSTYTQTFYFSLGADFWTLFRLPSTSKQNLCSLGISSPHVSLGSTRLSLKTLCLWLCVPLTFIPSAATWKRKMVNTQTPFILLPSFLLPFSYPNATFSAPQHPFQARKFYGHSLFKQESSWHSNQGVPG